MNVLEKIIDNLDTVFRGDAWHGPSVMELLNSMPVEKSILKHSFSHQTINQHIFHLTAWRSFVLEKLNDNIHFRLETDEDNWGKNEDLGSENFKALVNTLKSTHEKLIDKLETLDDSILERNVPGEYYNFYKLLNGLIQHDTYHLGMIWVLWE